MKLSSLLLILISVLLSASSQLMMKAGMSSKPVQRSMGGDGGIVEAIFSIALSPFVLAGLLCFGISVVCWLIVLSKVDVSQAYPCIALGIVVTTLGGHFLLGESLGVARVLGIGAIITGIIIVAVSP